MAYRRRLCPDCGKVLWTNPCHEVKPGNLYRAKATGPRGRHYGTRFWLVLGVNMEPQGGGSVHMAGINLDGKLVSTTSYGLHALHDRELVGSLPGTTDFLEYLKDADLPVKVTK